jgi:hypothetical protein
VLDSYVEEEPSRRLEEHHGRAQEERVHDHQEDDAFLVLAYAQDL